VTHPGSWREAAAQRAQAFGNIGAIFRGKLQPYGKADHESGFLFCAPSIGLMPNGPRIPETQVVS